MSGIDAIALSGGSAFGLDAASGVQAFLREQGRGFAVRTARVPIVPGAILFDLLSGGEKDWGRYPPYRELGYEAAAGASIDFALGSVGAGLGAHTVNLEGGLGSASAVVDGITVGGRSMATFSSLARPGRQALSDPLHSLSQARRGRGQYHRPRHCPRRHEATTLPFPGALPSWKDKFGRRL